MNKNSKTYAGNGLNWYSNALYKKMVAAYHTLNQSFSAGAIRYAKCNNPDLYRQMIDLEDAINTRFNEKLTKSSYLELTKLLGSWIATIKEMSFLHKSIQKG